MQGNTLGGVDRAHAETRLQAGAFRLDDTFRGVPAGYGPLPAETLGALNWSARAGDLALPALTVCWSTYRANREAIFDYAARHGALLAPHIKTPMSVDLARDLLKAGAWGVSVANAQQASVMLRGGVSRLLLANQLGGRKSGERFGRLLSQYPEAECALFIDSAAALAAAEAAGKAAGRASPVLIEIGAGRAGVRGAEAARPLIEAAAASGWVRLKGVAAYEGAAASADPQATREAIDRLNQETARAFAMVREAAPDERLYLSSGGSQYFDLVVAALAPLAEADGAADVILRGGAIFFHDHGVYARALERMDERNGFGPKPAAQVFRPAMRLWAELLSRPEPGLAICGMGMRDVSFDQGFPVPLNAWRDGARVATLEGAAQTVKLNDQHGFLRIGEDSPLQVGDLIEFGVSHPCTCFDRWRHFFLVDEADRVLSVHQTSFG